MRRAVSGLQQVVHFIRERDEPEPVALPLGGHAKEESCRNRTVKMSRSLAGVLEGRDFGQLTRAEAGGIEGEIDLLGSLELEDFGYGKAPFGGRFPIDLVETVPSLVVSQFLEFSSLADLRLGMDADGPAIQKVGDLLAFQLQVRVDTDLALNRPLVPMNPEPKRGAPIKIKAANVERATRLSDEGNLHGCFRVGLGQREGGLFLFLL